MQGGVVEEYQYWNSQRNLSTESVNSAALQIDKLASDLHKMSVNGNWLRRRTVTDFLQETGWAYSTVRVRWEFLLMYSARFLGYLLVTEFCFSVHIYIWRNIKCSFFLTHGVDAYLINQWYGFGSQNKVMFVHKLPRR